jgi:hypothetical protein
MKIDTDILSFHRGLLLFVRGLVVRTPSLERLALSRGAEAPLLHRIRSGATAVYGAARVRRPTQREVGAGALELKPGYGFTVMLAVARLPRPASLEVIGVVLLYLTPVLVARTFTCKEHFPDGASATPDRLITLDPDSACAMPPQVFVSPVGVPMTSPNGKMSVKIIPLSEVAVLGFVTVKVNVVAAPARIVAAPNALVSVGGWGGGSTTRVAVAGVPAALSFDVGEFVVLTFVPGVVP